MIDAGASAFGTLPLGPLLAAGFCSPLGDQLVSQAHARRKMGKPLPRVSSAAARRSATDLVPLAELEHRRRNFGAAVALADSVLGAVRELVGGREEVEALLRSGKVTPHSQLVCAALAIGIPAARLRFAGRPMMRAQFLDSWIEDAMLLLRRDLPPKTLRRIHALVIQTYFAIGKSARTDENRFWLDRLEKFDDLVRPSSPRGQETRRLRLMVRAEFEGDLELASAEAEAARVELINLPRHRKALEANGWWPRTVNE